VIAVIEDTGFDSYVCAYELTDLKRYVSYTKQQLDEEIKVEFMKSFINKFGQEI
jgi:hypothetical protein